MEIRGLTPNHMTKSAVSKQSSSDTRSSSPLVIYSSGRRASNLKLVNPEKELGNLLNLKANKRTEEFLRDVVNACASSVAVLNETGSLLYASQSWRLFEQTYRMNADQKARATDVFTPCLRIDDSALKNSARV